ncbi:hypothetical protein IF1G_10606 [Cordyceps javanica]|uniref:Uncharacterized protein n=1 Tax=Cordyceps javanica TaxID=43265 RepID=A0A545UMH1_9HYPO|nr:hypothetical protein IF1G_10606 [Cordyceps javanica]TQW02198.1 hypothetical protein IF2G_10206 [Cordyceps javanica]
MSVLSAISFRRPPSIILTRKSAPKAPTTEHAGPRSRSLGVWLLCDSCAAGQACGENACNLGDLSERRYFPFYKKLIGKYVDEGFVATQAFCAHEDLFAALGARGADPGLTRRQLADCIAQGRPVPSNAMSAAASLLVKVLFMVDASSARLFSTPGTLELGRFRTPRDGGGVFGDEKNDIFVDMERVLRASQLKKKLQVTDPAAHARLAGPSAVRPEAPNPRHFPSDNVSSGKNCGFLENRQVRQVHPISERESVIRAGHHEWVYRRQHHHHPLLFANTFVLLETLFSTQKILFPPSDARSRALLAHAHHLGRFRSRRDTVRSQSATARRQNEVTVTHHVYRAERLENLYEKTPNPTPRRAGWSGY